MNKAEERKKLIEDVIDLEQQYEYAEYTIPTLLRKIQELKPTKKEIEKYELQEMFDSYL